MNDNTPSQEVNFGPKFIGHQTPMWAKWLFRIFFYCTSTTGVALGIFTNIPVEVKMHIYEGITFANMAMHGFTKMFGVKVEDADYYEKPKNDSL